MEHAFQDKSMFLSMPSCSSLKNGMMILPDVSVLASRRRNTRSTRHGINIVWRCTKSKANCCRTKWVAGDDELGRSSPFRRALRKCKVKYVLAVPLFQSWVAGQLRRYVTRLRPNWSHFDIQCRSLRKDLAYFYHYQAKNILPPRRYNRRL